MQPILEICELEFSYPKRILFSDFTTKVYAGDKIAIIGDNGCGKSSLLKLIFANSGMRLAEIFSADGIKIAYVPQLITDHDTFSGGERFNQALSTALASYPDILLLDEPTNHLDSHNRKSLLSLYKHSPCTIITATHDIELLENHISIIWHIIDGKIVIFHGNYQDYLQEIHLKRTKFEEKIATLSKAKKEQHERLMQEQNRAKTSRRQGEKSITNRKWPTITSGTKARRAETTAGKNNAILRKEKDVISRELGELYLPEELNYKFAINSNNSGKVALSILNGSCRYKEKHGFQLDNINLSLSGSDRLVITGANGSGKSTLIKAILADPLVERVSGEWLVPSLTNIAYLDQHYTNIPADRTILEVISENAPALNYSEIRDFLNQFLFRKNEEVEKLGNQLSGGERVRLSLALVALQNPRLLILDEITNNIDLRTREHIINVLNSYSGALLVVSHDSYFLSAIGVNQSIKLDDIRYY